ncbi:SDR family NAD(P)-dependent oxidoreductase [Marinobacter sp. X15-166B]|uniref:SDR family NAD(P)-dependent oxidoreductase n=1 Tax=Marinobacter sp. X15-166B TaxID=1897620 RepID=UPI00085BCEEE|nr:SDR family NAD(P)-dependent oxidoreductase [Marinobacter sp. X15-166B]OEY67635.1 short-chain dehydrogenase [Marinobacter sp. X15-166B]
MNRRLDSASHIWLTGATSGIGQALAHQLIEQGHRLIVTGRRQEALEQIRAQAPQQVTIARGDITRCEDLKQMRAQLSEQSSVQMAILNSGTCEYLDIANFKATVIEHNINTNLIGTARCVELALPLLRASRAKNQPATLVIVSSSASWFPFARAEGYGASKAALTYFALSLRADLAAEGIDVVIVSPGFVKTPLTDRNDFVMPFLISAENAAQRVLKGLQRGRNHIHFPKRLTWPLKLLSALPQSAIDRLAASMTRPDNRQQENGS